ncbi:MAG: molybdenum cofactor biosynthesis protein MoaE [Thermoplasmatota archaeon]
MKNKIRVTEEDFNIDEIKRKVYSKESGAIVVFNGVVRGYNKGKEVEKLELQSYEDMTEKELEKVRQEAITNFDLSDVFIVHRVGELEVGENIVGIVVSAAHRGEAFDACKYCIDRLKEIVPLWKKETTISGESRWLDDMEV